MGGHSLDGQILWYRTWICEQRASAVWTESGKREARVGRVDGGGESDGGLGVGRGGTPAWINTHIVR